jgi:hypothetical protein
MLIYKGNGKRAVAVAAAAVVVAGCGSLVGGRHMPTRRHDKRAPIAKPVGRRLELLRLLGLGGTGILIRRLSKRMVCGMRGSAVALMRTRDE